MRFTGGTSSVFSSQKDSAAGAGFILFTLAAAQISLSQFLYLTICSFTTYMFISINSICPGQDAMTRTAPVCNRSTGLHTAMHTPWKG